MIGDADIVVIKLGGGLITMKDRLCEPDIDNINHMIRAISSSYDNNTKVILIHGAGSFGN